MFVLCEVREIYHLMVRACILLEKNIGPLTKAMIHGGNFSLDNNPQSLMSMHIARFIVFDLYDWLVGSCGPIDNGSGRRSNVVDEVTHLLL
jgi:hypothetical protein